MEIARVRITEAGRRPQRSIVIVSTGDNLYAERKKLTFEQAEGAAPLTEPAQAERDIAGIEGKALGRDPQAFGTGYKIFRDCMSSEHFGQLAWQFKRMSGSSGLKVQAAIAC
jgi:hypothetical protein